MPTPHESLRILNPQAPTSAPRPGPCQTVIFGGSGDLTRRKLLPAFRHLHQDGLLPERFHIIAFARSSLDQQAYREMIAADGDEDGSFIDLLDYHAGDYNDPQAYQALARHLAEHNAAGELGGNRLFYLATPPELYPVILRHLHASGLSRPDDGSWARVIIEKPYGHDLDSARALNAVVADCLAEDQVYRIDHYLGKETVQNILVLRFANTIFEPLWNRHHIDHIQITAAETLGVGSRAGFYDRAGVVRDFIQNHLLEVMALISMETPVAFTADPIRDEKVKVLRALRPVTAEMAHSALVAGQYDGYGQEPGVAAGSRTPTYAALRCHVDNWRWQGVPFYLRAGKQLAARVTEVAIHFKRIPFCVFGREELCQNLQPNVLTLRLQPDEGIALRFGCKTPGEALQVSDVLMDFRYQQAFGRPSPDAYQRLLLDAMRGDATLFARADAVDHAWRHITPLLQAIEDDPSFPIARYQPGSNGPSEADTLIATTGHRWNSLGGG